jgi:uncharacterized cupin superfamily protein
VPVAEAPFRETKFGLVADVDGWFVLNARDSRWRDYAPLEAACDFEGKQPFRQLGFNISVLKPGRSLGLYHRERHQEGFLVLSGECVLVVEGETRTLKAWDFFHCPGGTAHVIVGAGDGPAVVVGVGARGGRKGVVYEVDPVAIERGAGVEQTTTKSAEAYARFPRSARTRYREDWLPDL